MATSRARKSSKRSGKSTPKKRVAAAKKATPKKPTRKSAAPKRTASDKPAKKTAKKVMKKAAPRKPATKKSVASPARRGGSKPASRSVAKRKSAATPPKAAPVTARPAAADHTAARLARDPMKASWKVPGPPVELPRQPTPKAHAPTRKPPKPRAPKPKAISHEQAVANLQALLEAKKRREREGPSWPVQPAHGAPHRDEPTHAEKTSEPSPEATYLHNVPHDRGVTDR